MEIRKFNSFFQISNGNNAPTATVKTPANISYIGYIEKIKHNYFSRHWNSVKLKHNFNKLTTILKLIFLNLFFCDIFLIMNNIQGVNSQIVNFHKHFENNEVDKLHKLVQTGLGLKRIPEITKMNISQSEYTTKYKQYLERINERARLEAEAELFHLYFNNNDDISLRQNNTSNKTNPGNTTLFSSTNLTYSNHSFQGDKIDDDIEFVLTKKHLLSIHHFHNTSSEYDSDDDQHRRRWKRSLHAFNTNNDNFNNNNKNKTNISQHKKRKNINNKNNFNGSENDLIFMRFELANIKISNNQNNNNKDDASPIKSLDASNINNAQSILHKAARAKNTKIKLSTNNNKDNNEDNGPDEVDASLQEDDVELHPKDIEESVLNILLVRKQKNRNKKNRNTINNNKLLQKLNKNPNLVHKTANNTNSVSKLSWITRQPFHALRHQNHHQNARHRAKTAEVQGDLPNEKTVRILIYQLTEPYSKTWLDAKDISLDHLKHGQSQWVQLNIKKAVLGWLQDHEKNLGLEIICEYCNRNGISILHDYYSHPEQKPVLNIIAKKVQREKRGRSRVFYPIVPDYITPPKRTSCSTDDVRKRCCRHPMLIDFHEISGFEFIIQPRIIDAGFCRGRCPPKYNPASHHAFLMSILNLDGLHNVPKRCCTALKLSEIDILHVDGEDPSKLSVSKWEDMRVMECACA